MSTPPNQLVSFTKGDASRIASFVRAFESRRRIANPSRLARASGESDGDGPIRIGLFTGAWPNEAPNNVRTVQLLKVPSISSVVGGVPLYSTTQSVTAVNWLAYLPTNGPMSGGAQRKCVLGLVDFFPSGQQLWLLLAAEC